MPPSTRSVGDRQAGVGLGRLEQVGAPVGDALEHGPDQLGPARAPGDARAGCPGRRSPTPACPGRAGRGRTRRRRCPSHRAATLGRLLGASSMMPRSSRSHSTQRAGREHDGLDAPGRARPPRCQATMGNVPDAARVEGRPGRSRPVHRSSMPPVPKVALASPGRVQPWPTSDACWSPAIPQIGGAPGRARGLADHPRRVDDRAGSMASGMRSALRAAGRPSADRVGPISPVTPALVASVTCSAAVPPTASRPPRCRRCRSTGRLGPARGRGRPGRGWRPAWWPTRWGRAGSPGPAGPGRSRRCAGPASRCPGPPAPRCAVPHDGRGPLVGDADAGHRTARRPGRPAATLEDGLGHAPRRRTRPGPGPGVAGRTATWWTWSTVASGRTTAGPHARGADVDDQDAAAGRSRPRRRSPKGEGRPELARVEDAGGVEGGLERREDVEGRSEGVGQEARPVEADAVVVADRRPVAVSPRRSPRPRPGGSRPPARPGPVPASAPVRRGRRPGEGEVEAGAVDVGVGLVGRGHQRALERLRGRRPPRRPGPGRTDQRPAISTVSTTMPARHSGAGPRRRCGARATARPAPSSRRSAPPAHSASTTASGGLRRAAGSASSRTMSTQRVGAVEVAAPTRSWS